MTLTECGVLTGVVTGVTGTVLGVISAINIFDRNRVKLRVTPIIAWKQANVVAISTNRVPELNLGNPNTLAVEIVNLSAFPVTISEVGLDCPEPAIGPRVLFFQSELTSDYTWPPVLESRRSVTVFQSFQRLPQPSGQSLARWVYAETVCGKVMYGRSAGLNWLAQHYAELRAGSPRSD